jgi:hypothetical protein
MRLVFADTGSTIEGNHDPVEPPRAHFGDVQ